MELGKRQELKIMRLERQGAYVGDGVSEDILLPVAEIPQGASKGDIVEAFVYKDSEDRPIATVKRPLIEVGQTAVLEVAQINNVGAFLKWGLMKDLFLPFAQQEGKVNEGDNVLVALYVDNSERLCATMKVYEYLSADSPYKKDDEVSCTIYRIKQGLGALAAVDGKYYGLIPTAEIYHKLHCGQTLTARVARVRADGRLDLALRKKAYATIDGNARTIMEKLASCGGRLPFGDGSLPEDIRREFGMSKNDFKRAAGRLLKDRKIRMTDSGIEAL